MKPILALMTCLFAGCVGIPENIKPVENFDVQRYLGTWYEIARLDHSFERGLTRTTAQYSLRDDGGVRVINRGFLAEENKWKESEGKAFFVGAPNLGHLKVSFFGPFYGSYIVVDLDPGYQHSLVCGPDRSYFWILSRIPELPEAMKQKLVSTASALGFDTAKLIYVDQHQERSQETNLVAP